MDVVGRVLSMDPNERRGKMEKVIIDNNIKMPGRRLNKAMQKVQNEGKLYERQCNARSIRTNLVQWNPMLAPFILIIPPPNSRVSMGGF